jgi:hypothetical protein
MCGWMCWACKTRDGLTYSTQGRPARRHPATHRYFTGAHRVFVLDLDTSETTVVAGDGTAGYVSTA